MRFGFSRGADHAAGDSSGHGQAGSQFVSAGFALIAFAAFFGAFDHIAVGITLTLATVAATTLAAGATAWTITTFGVVLAIVLQLLFALQHFLFFTDRGGLFGAWLAFFTRCTWLALFSWGTGRTLFSDNRGSGTGDSADCRSGIQRFAQFTHAFFTLATWLAIFTWGTRCTFFAWSARCAFLTGYGRGFFTGFAWCTFLAGFTWDTLFAWCAFLAWFTRCTFFTWRTLFARLAFFIAATITVAALLTTVAALFVAGWALGGRFLDHDRCDRLFLGGEQADQGLHQALEQAWLGNRSRGGSHRGDHFGRHRRVGAGRGGLDRGFLANQGAGRGGRLDFLDFGSGSGDFVAGLVGVGFRAVVAQTLHFEVRRLEVIVRQDHDTGTGAQFDLGDRVAFFVEQERGNRDRHLGADFGGAVLQGFFFDQAQDRQGQRLDVTDDAGAVAAWADDAAAFAQGRTQALTGHFQQAEARDATDLHAGTVGFQAFADFFFHGALVLGRGHVDEVDHDQAADVAQAQLAGDFFSGFQVGLQRGFFDVAAFGGACRVDVDGHQGFGRIDHDGAAGRQFDNALEGGLDLAFDLEAVEQRDAVFVQLDLAGVLRHHLADEGQGFVLGLDAVDQHFADVLAQVVADGADDHVAFLVDQERCGTIQGRFLDRGPELQQVVEVPLHFFAAAAQAGSAHDQAHVGRCHQAVQRFTQFVAFFAFDATGNAAGTRVVRHQDQVTTGQADEGGQGGALVATFFFFDLDDDFLAFAQDVLDIDAAFRGLLEVFAGDFFQRQEAVALRAEIDKGSLEAWFDASNPAFIDVGLLLLACTGFDIQVVEALAVYQCNTQLFGLSCVNQHSFHVVPSVSGLPETAFGTHDFSRSVSGASGVVGHSSV